MFNLLLIRGGIKGGFPLSIIGKRGEGYQHNQHKPQEQGKEKGREREGKRRRRERAESRGAKVEKVAEKIFFFAKVRKKNMTFRLGGAVHIAYNNPQPLYI